MNSLHDSRRKAIHNRAAIAWPHLKAMKARAPTVLAPRSLPPLPNPHPPRRPPVFLQTHKGRDGLEPASIHILSQAVRTKSDLSGAGYATGNHQRPLQDSTPSEDTTTAAGPLFPGMNADFSLDSQPELDGCTPLSPPPPYLGPQDDDDGLQQQESLNADITSHLSISLRPPSYASSLTHSRSHASRSLLANNFSSHMAANQRTQAAKIKQYRRMLPFSRVVEVAISSPGHTAVSGQPRTHRIEELLASLPPPPRRPPPVPPAF